MRKPAPLHVRPVWAVCCLLAYLFSATPLLPIATALVAWVDGEHYVLLSADNASMRIVLRHDARDGRTALTHSHCVVSRALSLLAEPAGPEHSDHVLSFQKASSIIARSAPLRPTPQSTIEMPMAPAVPATRPLPQLRTNVEAPFLDLPPPATSVVVARATVFLI